MLRASPVRELKPGTTGWSVDDLKDPTIRRLWDQGRYEIIEGVLAVLPAARLDHSGPIGRMIFLLPSYADSRGLAWTVAPEVDIVAAPPRVLRADLVVMTPGDIARQRAAGSWDDDEDTVGLVVVPPTLVLEVVSQGH